MYTKFTRLIDRIQFFGLLLATVLVPIIFNVNNQNIVLFKPILAQMIAFVLFGLWLVDSIERNQFELPKSALNVPVVLYGLWLIVTVVLRSHFMFFSLEELGRYFSVFLFFFLTLKCVRDYTRLKWTMWILFAVCLLTTGYGVLQYQGLGLIDWGREVLVSTYGNKNFFAGFLVLTTPVIFGYAAATSKLPIRIILTAVGAVQFYVIILTETRTGFLGFFVGVLLFFGLTVRFVVWPRVDRKRLLLIGALVILLAGMVGLYSIAPRDLMTRLGDAFDLQQGTARVRWIMWTGSSRAALDRPLTGHGHGVFQLVFPNYRPTFYHRFRVSHNTRHSHNEFLEVLMETGAVGLSLFLLLIVVFGVVAYRFLARNRSWFYQFLVIGLVSGVAGSLAQNFASVNLRWMSSTYTFWLIFALVPATIRVASNKEYHIRDYFRQSLDRSYRLLPSLSRKTLLHGLIALVLVGAGYGFYRIVQSDYKLKSMNALIRYAEAKRLPWSRAIREGELSTSYNPYNLSAKYKLGYIFLKTNDYERAYDTYDNLTDIAPNYAQIHNNIALIHRRFDNPYRSLLHFEWATWLEDNTRNHMNLMRRYTREKLTNRAIWHGLHVPRIQIEEDRNTVHRHVVSLNDREFSVASKRIERRTSQRRKYRSGLQFLNRNFETSNPKFARLTELLLYLDDPTSKQTISRVYRAQSQGEMISPYLFLGITTQLRDSRGKSATRVRRQYLSLLSRWINENPESDPLYRLVAADLYAQVGQADVAAKLISRPQDRWTSVPVFRRTLESIRERTGNSSG